MELKLGETYRVKRPAQPIETCSWFFSTYNLRVNLDYGAAVEIGRFSMSVLFHLRLYRGRNDGLVFKCGAFCEAAKSLIISGGNHRNSSLFNNTLGGSFGFKHAFFDREAVALSSLDEPRLIEMGDNVVVSEGACVLDGATIGDGCVIGAGAVVSGSCEPYGIYVGTPAKRLRDRFDDPKRLDLYRQLRLSEVATHHVPRLPGILHRLEEGGITIDDYRRDVQFQNSKSEIVISGKLGAENKIGLGHIEGYNLNGERVTDIGAIAVLNKYFGQLWQTTPEFEWTPNIFSRIAL